jgi:hypothetical protein
LSGAICCFLVNLEKLVVRTGAACLAVSALLLGGGHLLHWPALLRLGRCIPVAFVLIVSLPPLAAIAMTVTLDWRKRRRWVTEMRTAWDTASHRLGLTRSEGARPFDDRMHGDVDGARVELTLRPDDSLQKPVTFVRLLDNDPGPHLSLTVADTISLSRSATGVDGNVLTQEQYAWLSGARKGIGARIANGNLEYLQLWAMTDADEVVFVVKALVKMNRCIRAARGR